MERGAHLSKSLPLYTNILTLCLFFYHRYAFNLLMTSTYSLWSQISKVFDHIHSVFDHKYSMSLITCKHMPVLNIQRHKNETVRNCLEGPTALLNQGFYRLSGSQKVWFSRRWLKIHVPIITSKETASSTTTIKIL